MAYSISTRILYSHYGYIQSLSLTVRHVTVRVIKTQDNKQVHVNLDEVEQLFEERVSIISI